MKKLLVILLLLAGLSPASTQAQGGLPVVATTGTYWSAPRSVQVLDVTLPNGQHLWFDRDLCRTFAWLDTDNTTELAYPEATGDRWPETDLTITGYSSQGGLWSSDWGTNWQPHFDGYTTTPTSFTATCDYPKAADPNTRYTIAATYTSTTRPEGTGYSIQLQFTPPSGENTQSGWIRQSALGNVGGDGQPLNAWDFDGDGFGLRQMPWQGMGNEYDTQFWVILTHPQGSFVLAQPNLHDPAAFGGWALQQAWTGFAARKYTSGTTVGDVWTSDPLVYLWSPAAGRTAPQMYLDARYALLRDWADTLGLGPQHLPMARAGGGGGQINFPDMSTLATWQNGWNSRFLMLSEQTTMYEASQDPISPDLYLPNASDLPGLAQPVMADYGTLQQFRDGMNLMRILGLGATYWSQWGYHNGCGGNELGETSRFDNQPQSYFFREHPEFASGTGCNLQVDYNAPGVFPWMEDWSSQYWLDYGMQGRFMDSSPQIPGVYTATAPQFVDYLAWYYRHGGYIMGETPQSFLGPLYYNAASTYQLWGREWGAPFTTTGERFRNCLGVGQGHDTCAAANAGLYTSGVHYDVASAHRLHSVGGAYGVGGQDWLTEEYTNDAANVPATQAELLKLGQLQDKYGLPDRIQLVNPTVPSTNPWPVVLGASLDINSTTVWVNPAYQLPQAGTIQVGSEQISYTGIDSDSGLNMGVTTLQGVIRGANSTTAAAHTANDTVTPLNDLSHWVFDDAYWVYGTSPNEVWVKVSDESVWDQGGTTPANVPQISDVGVNGNTVQWTTDRPSACWVDYDTYGSAESQNSQRPAGWWPNYLKHTNLDDPGAPTLATSHSRTVDTVLGNTYHYRIACRGPAPAVTQDATFVAQAPSAPCEVVVYLDGQRRASWACTSE